MTTTTASPTPAAAPTTKLGRNTDHIIRACMRGAPTEALAQALDKEAAMLQLGSAWGFSAQAELMKKAARRLRELDKPKDAA